MDEVETFWHFVHRGLENCRSRLVIGGGRICQAGEMLFERTNTGVTWRTRGFLGARSP